jgi:hypothetical protein
MYVCPEQPLCGGAQVTRLVNLEHDHVPRVAVRMRPTLTGCVRGGAQAEMATGLEQMNARLAEEGERLAALQLRFDNREPRAEDVAKIKELEDHIKKQVC